MCGSYELVAVVGEKDFDFFFESHKRAMILGDYF